ncbi:cancer-associated gene 1 protein isoform X2 [Sciurus carolinensis]|uniref:cancer-associated gene 1 protein isoform X2 n=1 Tax=Sciurus carolinensis TaxID=30640 RepID=UPI001FB3A319|nr:cancer-associated gene 1 protein isoform X2 [Sciurus carolinensis]
MDAKMPPNLQSQAFHHSADRNKGFEKFWPSPSDPVHFEVETCHEKLESMSESDALNFSVLSEDLTHSHSPFCMETGLSASYFPQNETKNAKRENESKPTLSEDICSIQDSLGDNIIGNYSRNIQIQPVNTCMTSLRQFEPICKFHQLEAFNDEMTTFQNLTEDFSYMEKPELQSLVYNYAKDTNIKQDLCKEENPMETSISANKDQLAHECVRQSAQSPHLIHCNGETLQYMEKSLAKSTAMESVLNPSQPQSFLYKEGVLRNFENPFYNENSFSLLHQRVNYKTEETEVSSKETQNPEEIAEMSVSQQEETTARSVESPGVVLSWSPGISRSGGTSWENCLTPDTQQSLESLQPLEEDMALNEALRKLKYTNKKQQMRIHDFQCKNLHLEKKVKELQMKITKQQVFIDIINKLKENIEELIEDKYNIILERNDVKKKLQNLQEILTNTKKRLQESKKEKEILQMEVKKVKVSYIRLQERCITEMQQKNRSVSQCIEMDKTLSKKEEEIRRLQQLNGEMEKTTTSALDLLKREKETREQKFSSLQENFQKLEKENFKERQKLKSRIDKLIPQVKNLLVTCENEKAKNSELQQQINGVKNENTKLQLQVSKSEEQNCVPKFKRAQLIQPLEELMEPDVTKDTKMIHSNLLLNCSPCEEESLNTPGQKTPQLTSKIHSLLSLMVGLLTCQDITNPDVEHCKENEKVSDIMLQKLKSLLLRKIDLDKELLKHKDRITTFRELIASEKAFQDHLTEVTNFDSDEAKNVTDAPVLLGVKLDKYHSLNEELDFLITKLGDLLESKEDHCNRLMEENDKYQRHLGNLINKVTSYEEIIKCADQRLEISHFQIAHLEERNKCLEDLMRRPRERARKSRPRLENHPKSMTLMPDIFKGNRNDFY